VIDSLRRRDPAPEVYARRAERYVEVLGHSKGALMKAGQMLSIVPVLSTDPKNRTAFHAAMVHLQADAPPMDPELAADVIRSELGRWPDKAFAEFAPLPIAAASIGQVHVARLHDGRPVAVKVQYPGVADAIRSDLRNTELVSVFLQMLRSVVPGLSRSDPKAIAAEVSTRINEELDYRHEASNQRFFADAYKGHPFIRIPEVVTELSTDRVLTQELAEGLAWSDALQQEQSLRNAWGESIYRFSHGSLRRLRAVIADAHPGNYIFHLDGTVSFLDFGCVKRFSPELVNQVHSIYRAALKNAGDLLARILIDGGHFDEYRALSGDELLEHYRVRFEMITGPQPFTVTQDYMARIIEHEYSMKGASGRYMRSVKTADDWLFFVRVEVGLMSVLAALQATTETRAVAIEMDLDGPPATPCGIADAEYWTARSVAR
jgi:predicted unusual protein kinase regulating ubiquinone biosynthesis (AarF/ABC1/UbiB family)